MNKRAIRPGVIGLAALLFVMLLLTVLHRVHWATLNALAVTPHAAFPIAATAKGPTVINVSSQVLHEGVSRFGINLGGHTFYDSLQVLKNLVSRNPGFEGHQWQTILQCERPGTSSCTGGPNSGSWPEGFLDGGTYEVLSGAARGQTGAIIHSTAGTDHVGTTLQFSGMSQAVAGEDYIVVRKQFPGDAASGWDAQTHGGATVSTEFKDLSPRTPGVQAVRIDARGPGQYVYLKQYFDAGPGRSYLQMKGPYELRFRAKGLSGSRPIVVSVDRGWAGPGGIFRQTVALDGDWRDYTYEFNTAEPSNAVGTVALAFIIEGAEVLIDDVVLTEANPNGTSFRNDVVATLERLKPGVLRYMDSGQNWGSSLDNMLAPEEGRMRSGYSRYSSEPNDIPIGLNDFLTLCEKISAVPWYTMQIGMSENEATNLMEFLAGPASSKYGAMRAAQGHPVPWTETFPIIHLEFGNEAWNRAQPGETFPDPVPYAERATAIFAALRSSKWYSPGQFNFIVDGQSANLYLNKKVLEVAQGIDTIDIAPYTFNTFGDDSSIEHIFGPMFAETEMLDSSTKGYVHQQAEVAAKAAHPAHLAIYETNVDTNTGIASQASIDSTVPSVGAGIASLEHMLLMLRDDGISVQNTFQLGGSALPFTNTAGGNNHETSPIWGVVLDMGGPTNRVRPSFLAQQLANQAIRPTMLVTSVGGADPTWDQPRSANDDVELNGAHELQSFAFEDKDTTSMILLNVSRTESHTLTLAGDCAPHGTVTVQTLTSAKITDSNELEDKVKIESRAERNVVAGRSSFSLPPFSMTVFTSANQGCFIAKK